MKIAETNLDEFRKYIANIIAERTGVSDKELANKTDRAIIWLTIAAAYGTVKRISYAVGHQDLTTTYEKVLTANGDLATWIIDAAVKLDHYDAVPEQELRRINQRVMKSKNLFSYTVVRDLIGDFLYLYNTSYQTMQSLGDMWNIKVSASKFLVNRAKKG